MGDLYAFLEKGGILMIPILAASVAAIAVFVEKLWTLRRRLVSPPGLFDTLSQLIGTKSFEQAESVCARAPNSLSRLAMAVLSRRTVPKADVQEALDEVGRSEAKHLGRNVEIMGIVATIAPLLGLLGTVTGMIQVFKDVSETQGDPKVEMLAGGIWEALITTAAGLTVAIIAYLCYRFINSKVDDLVRDLEEKTSLFVELTYRDTKAKATPAPTPEEATDGELQEQ